jgi:uncharacterized protein (TIGR03067 family)
VKLPLAAATAAALFVVTAPGVGQDAAGKKGIEGTWELVAVARDGQEKELPPGADKTTLTFAGGVMTAKGKTKEGGDKQKTAKYTVDTTKTPHWIEMKAENNGQTDTSLGLYEVKGDTLRIAFGRPGGDRPASLESKEGDKLNVPRFKRVK